MPTVVGVRFKDSGKVYFFDPNGMEGLSQGDPVIVETARGPELARVARAPYDVEDQEVIADLKPVLRLADVTDFERLRVLNERHQEVLARCAEKVQEHALPMRLVKAEYSFDGSRLTFYFTAEKRVDFRMLVRDLARTFRTRIELRQIGPRDEAKLLGGIGPCGRLLCCATFLPDYARVSIKMAKDQDLPLNPVKISGVCGRLLCCLSYEHEQYLVIKEELPRKGSWVQTPDGPGEVVSVNVVRETVTVELAGSGVQEEFKPEQVQEASRRVSDLARSRAEEGITPASRSEPRPPRPARESKHIGERRLLRDEIDNPEVLEALALLEDGFEERTELPRDTTARQPPMEPPRARHGPPAERQRQAGFPDQRASTNEGSHFDQAGRRRMNRPQRPGQSQPRNPLEQQGPSTPPQSSPPPAAPAGDRSRVPRRRRRE